MGAKSEGGRPVGIEAEGSVISSTYFHSEPVIESRIPKSQHSFAVQETLAGPICTICVSDWPTREIS